MPKHTIAIFGSAFNPPHRGHEDVIQQAFSQFDTVILVPSYRHAFGKSMMPFDLRLKMVEALASELQSTLPQGKTLTVSCVENALAETKSNDSPIYTYDVLDYFAKHFNSDNLSFIVGPDNAQPETWKKFYKSEEILTRWKIWPAEERIALRSTMLREKASQGITPNINECNPIIASLLMKT